MDTRAPSASPRGAQDLIPAACLPRRAPGRDPHPLFGLQNGAEGTRCPSLPKLFVPFQVEDPRPGDPPAPPPSPASQTGKDRGAEGAGPHETGTARAANPRSADCPIPARRPLPTAHRTLRTPQPGHNRTMRPRRSGGPRCRPRPEDRSPSAWGGTEHRPRPLHPPRLRAKDAFGGAANPSPESRGLTNARPAPARRAHPLRGLGLWKAGSFSGARPSSPSAPRSRSLVAIQRGRTRPRRLGRRGGRGWISWGRFHCV